MYSSTKSIMKLALTKKSMNLFSTAKANDPSELIRSAAQRLPKITDQGFGSAFDKFISSNVRVVLLGEASHGTSEFYRARAAITKHLIEKHGFNMVAVEADWPDAAVVDRHVRGKQPTKSEEPAFTRFPTWMWRNTDVNDFLKWMLRHNSQIPDNEKTGFYGLDLYNMNASMKAVIEYLDGIDPEAAKVARKRYGCLDAWSSDPQRYGREALYRGYAPCEKGVIAMLQDLLKNRLEYMMAENTGEEFLNAELNALLVKDAEKYYRAMYYGDEESWNLRDSHMFETLERLLGSRSDAKAVVWAHNSHIGDARYTGMGTKNKEHNIGQLTRQKYGNDACLIGFGTHTGTVAAASEWNMPMEVKKVRSSLSGSYEKLCHETGIPSFALDLREDYCPKDLRKELMKERLERFIGVIYSPETERWSHYMEAILPKQFDCFVWFDETSAVDPLPVKQKKTSKALDETYPFGY